MSKYKAVVSEILTREHGEKRYVVIDPDTRRVLDNNENYGYRTEGKALAKYELKTFGELSNRKEKLISKREKQRHAEVHVSEPDDLDE